MQEIGKLKRIIRAQKVLLKTAYQLIEKQKILIKKSEILNKKV